ncbi:MAG: carboxypeptidase-like regulatory domain-containing protein [Bryobacteraceae bacterium]
MRVWFVLFMLLAVAVVATPADPPMTKLRIEVKTINDTPVERASVIVAWAGERSTLKLGKRARLRWETRTNQEGLASIPLLPQGKILIQVIAKGFQTFGKTVEVAEDEKTIEVVLNPPQPQYSAH